MGCQTQAAGPAFLELIEAYGTGIIKIMEAYEGTGMTPQIETSDNTFQVILPNLNTMPEPARQMQVNPSFIQFFFQVER